MEDNELPVSSRRPNPRKWRSQNYWPFNNLRNFYFLFYFSRHKLEFSLNNAQAKKFHVKTRKRFMVHEPRATKHGFKKVLHETRLTAFCK